MPTSDVLPIDGNHDSSSRRNSHGGMVFATAPQMRQPQDGAAPAAPPALRPFISTPTGSEPEDAQLTGSTRSLFRRVMGLNIFATAEDEETAKKEAAILRRHPQAQSPIEVSGKQVA